MYHVPLLSCTLQGLEDRRDRRWCNRAGIHAPCAFDSLAVNLQQSARRTTIGVCR